MRDGLLTSGRCLLGNMEVARLELEREWQLNPTTHGRAGTTASKQPNDSCGQPGRASPNVWLSGSGTGSTNVYWVILISSVFI